LRQNLVFVDYSVEIKTLKVEVSANLEARGIARLGAPTSK